MLAHCSEPEDGDNRLEEVGLILRSCMGDPVTLCTDPSSQRQNGDKAVDEEIRAMYDTIDKTSKDTQVKKCFPFVLTLLLG